MHPGQVRGPDLVAGGGVGRDDVGGFAAVDHDPVDLVPRFEVLAEQPDGDLGDGDAIGRVDADLGRHRGVGRLAVEVVVAGAGGQGREDVALGRSRVHHHRGVDAVEGAGLQHRDLAPAALLGRGPEHPDREVEVIGQVLQGQPGTDTGRDDHVVATGVSHPWQGVVLGADTDGQRAAPVLGDERGRQVGDPGGDGEAGAVEHITALGRGPLLLEGQLGVIPDGVRQTDQLIGGTPDGSLHRLLGLGDEFGCWSLVFHGSTVPDADTTDRSRFTMECGSSGW